MEAICSCENRSTCTGLHGLIFQRIELLNLPNKSILRIDRKKNIPAVAYSLGVNRPEREPDNSGKCKG
jgi:hypothetical protein